MLDRTQRFVLWFPCRSASDLYSFKSKAKHLSYVELTIILKSSIAPPDGTTDNSLFTACNQSLWQGNAFTPVCNSVHRGRGLYPGAGSFLSRGFVSKGWSLSRWSLSRWVSVQRVSVQGIFVQGISVQGGLCQRGVSVRGDVYVQGSLCPVSLCTGGSLSRVISVEGAFCLRDHLVW